MLNKIDIRPILRGHLATLRDNAFAQSVSKGDITLFGIIPTATAAVILEIGFRFRIDAVNGFLNIFSILTGLLLNLLVLVLTLPNIKAPEGIDPVRRARLIREIFANICFAVLEAVIVVCVALVAISYMRSSVGATTGPIATFLLVALTFNFILSLIMVLKRMYVLVGKDLKNDSHPKAA